MKTTLITFTAIVTFVLSNLISIAQTKEWKLELALESNEVLLSMLKEEPNLLSYYDNSYALLFSLK